MKKEIFVGSFGGMFWRRYSNVPGAKAYREIIAEGFFEADYAMVFKGCVYAFDLTNGVFLHCQSRETRYTNRPITLVEYEQYAGLNISTDNPHTMLIEWRFHLNSFPFIASRRSRVHYNATNDFLSMLKARDQGIIDASRKPGYQQWREKMKQKGWLIDREADSQIMAQRRGEQVLEIVPLEELEGTSNMQGR
ncbi:hypothetical protein ABW286_21585 [Erwinia papayae]|uniref:Uncharacterized protein n=1 Tax=Erwinia papayae TaxID=206499 RepID=A0ABV3N7D8_9GAMM